MPRKLRPCGTQSAYRRHLNRGEAPCAECRAANTARTNPGSQSALRVGEQEWGAALNANPPVITWRRKNNGIWVATSVQDPHAETAQHRKRDEEFAADLDAYFAPHPAIEPECTDENLLTAARTEI